MSKLVAKWVPRLLTVYQKYQRDRDFKSYLDFLTIIQAILCADY